MVTPHGKIPADLLVITDAPTKTDELLNRPMVGPDGKYFQMLLAEAAYHAGVAVPNSYIIPVVLCRAHTGNVDRVPTRQEVLKCMSNVTDLALQTKNRMTILVGEIAKTFYVGEFPEAITILPMWWYRKHPSYWTGVVQTVADGMQQYLKQP